MRMQKAVRGRIMRLLGVVGVMVCALAMAGCTPRDPPGRYMGIRLANDTLEVGVPLCPGETLASLEIVDLTDLEHAPYPVIYRTNQVSLAKQADGLSRFNVPLTLPASSAGPQVKIPSIVGISVRGKSEISRTVTLEKISPEMPDREFNVSDVSGPKTAEEIMQDTDCTSFMRKSSDW